MLNEEQFKACLPKAMTTRVNPEVMDAVNNALADPMVAEMMSENIMGYTHVLKTGKFKLVNYVNAVRYVSYKVMGNSNLNSFVKTFPDKYQEWVSQGVTGSDIASYITAYNKSKLVIAIYTDTLVPTHILNAHRFQEAINIQVEIMNNEDASYKVRSDAANSLMTHLKAPEAARVEMDITIKEDSALGALKENMAKLVRQQQEMIIDRSTSVKDIAEAGIIIEHDSGQA